ncbi:MAG: hypothetical protein R2855_05660 [Thermomicrobiales bacterium]
MRIWAYLFGVIAAVGIVALIVTDNRADGETVAPQAANTTADLEAGAFEASIGLLSPATSIQLLIDGGTLPESAIAPLEEASGQYQQALSVPPAEAAELLEQSLANLNEAEAIVEEAAIDASNQVSKDALKRSASAIDAIAARVESDLGLVQQTGSPVPSVVAEGEEK